MERGDAKDLLPPTPLLLLLPLLLPTVEAEKAPLPLGFGLEKAFFEDAAEEVEDEDEELERGEPLPWLGLDA